MSTELRPVAAPIIVRPGPAPGVAYADADYAISAETASRLLDATPANTRAAYHWAWSRFTQWCSEAHRVDLPATAQTLADYIGQMIGVGLAPSTIDQAIGAIRSIHRDAGYPKEPDTTAALKILKAYRREWADAGGRLRKARPLLLDGLRAMVETCEPGTTADVRDRAMLLLGFNLMARRSETAALDLASLTEVDEGLTVSIRHSKTDQAAVGAEVAVPYGQHAATCAVRAVRAWVQLLRNRGVESGPLFRPIDRHGRIGTEKDAAGRAADRLTGKSVSAVIQRRGRRAELPYAGELTGHSIRSGAVTVAYAAGVPISIIAEHGRWSPKSPVVLGYIRAVDRWQNNAMKGIGL